MRITKIKYDQDTVSLEMDTPGTDDKMTLKSKLDPAETFTKALAALKKYYIKFQEYEKLDPKKISAVGIKLFFAGAENKMSVAIIGVRELINSTARQVQDSPTKAVEATQDAAEELVGDDCEKAIRKLILEAEKYAKGNRLQKDMFKE